MYFSEESVAKLSKKMNDFGLPLMFCYETRKLVLLLPVGIYVPVIFESICINQAMCVVNVMSMEVAL